ncbi:MAG: hypothetical protein NTW87_11245, partial [Planctomycetota bacterium]|nr:hypothetical protein [Planctomycetota bacterium]
DALIDHYRADIFCEIDFLDSVDRAGERNFLREKLLDAAEDAAKAEAGTGPRVEFVHVLALRDHAGAHRPARAGSPGKCTCRRGIVCS